MIRAAINEKFPHQIINRISINNSIYIVDYTEQTRNDVIKRGVEVFDNNPPTDIEPFTIENSHNMDVDCILFDNNSFVKPNGEAASQCECVIYPSISNVTSWICFIELKYSNIPRNNIRNLNKARKQLFKTQYYYKSVGVFNRSNTCYLFASLPKQSPPFANMSLTPAYLVDMKRKHNIVIRFQNTVDVVDDKILNV